MEIYVLIDEKPQGPYTPDTIRRQLVTGRFKPTDLAAYAGSADWKPLSAMIQSWNQSSAASPAKSSKRNLVAAIAVAAVLLLVGATIFFISKSRGTIGGDGGAAEVFHSPIPKTLAELNTWYAEPPEGQNAAVYFGKGFDAYQITDADINSKELPVVGGGTLPPPGTPIPDGTKTVMTDFVRRNDAAWAGLQQGMGFEQSRYPIDLNLGSEVILPHLIKVKRAAQFANLKAALCAADNEPDAATDTVLVSLAIAESLKDEPILISQLVRVACHAIDAAALQNILNSVALSRDDLQRLSAAFAKVEVTQAQGEGFTRSLVGERVFNVTFFDLPPDKLRQEIKSWQNGTSDAATAKMMESLKAQRAFVDETYNHAFALRLKPFPERSKVDEYFTARANEARKKGYLLCHTLLSSLGKASQREARGLAELRLTQTAIALERYRWDNGGGYPDSLSALVPKFLPEIPVDPVKGQEMHYEKSGEGYKLTSSAINSPKPLSFDVTTPPKLPL